MSLPSLSSLPFITYDFGTRFSPPPSGVVTVHQIHSAIVTRPHSLPDADALIDDTPGIALGVKTADCVPILLADPVRRAVAAIHAGWRGTAAHIVPAAIQSMRDQFGTNPADLHAAIGPSIGPCCYQVGPDVAAQFGIHGSTPVHLNLAQINQDQLEDQGVLAARIWQSPDCTKCNPDYHSFRREQQAAGRMISWIGIRKIPLHNGR